MQCKFFFFFFLSFCFYYFHRALTHEEREDRNISILTASPPLLSSTYFSCILSFIHSLVQSVTRHWAQFNLTLLHMCACVCALKWQLRDVVYKGSRGFYSKRRAEWIKYHSKKISLFFCFIIVIVVVFKFLCLLLL